MIHLELINDQDLHAPDAAQFQNWADLLANQLQTSGAVCIKIVDATESQTLNSQYRGKDQPTNVLSFPAEIPDFVESDQLGDLAICAEVVEREAAEQNKAVEHHWAHMTIHGLLHLLGYDHIEDEEAESMEALEVQLLSALEVANPYQ